jgi:hypothetical protein
MPKASPVPHDFIMFTLCEQCERSCKMYHKEGTESELVRCPDFKQIKKSRR